ncbi:hypothetical protein CDLVIII_1217 [Clostridium sp. DL-VIII]|uniref:hypothetical protein n=1 Tax=Clostridium sp. DL-VIII TaxID=641107 RepID=UPI00023AF691|nr:hypothetical protein [Clostridium sp. DL-VIII]EHI97919.1 hypothetical protein CDLVIII_1217 [Clostridium sp. DL-VIII]
MNYIWEMLLKADKQNMKREDIKFVHAKMSSPYMEISLNDLNLTSLPEDNVIEVNEYYRFYEIFKDLFNINIEENQELREVLLDVLLHYLGELDLKMGLCKTEFYKKFLFKDILNSVFGEKLAKDILCFEKEELDVLLNGFITIYRAGISLQLFKEVLRKIFVNSVIYISKERPKNVYIYLDEYQEKKLETKINVIVETFLPINMKPLIFWDKHFGIIGLENTMKINEIVMIE